MGNIIKKKYGYILLVLFAISSGCSDWLDVSPRNEMKEEEMYKNEEGFKSALMGAYVQLAEKDLYGRDASMYLPELLAQHWTIPTSNTQLRYNMSNFNYTHETVEKALETLWKKYYQCIVHLNNVLGNLETTGVSFSNGNKELIKGEALGLRGFLHLEILRFFGPIPGDGANGLPAIPYQEEMTKDPGKLVSITYEKVCEKIIRDLNAAEEFLSKDPIVFGSNDQLNRMYADSEWEGKPQDEWQFYRQVRFNYYAVKGAKARFYHWIGDKENAVKYAKEVIEAKNTDETSKFELTTESIYSTIFKGSNLVMKSEHLFGVHNPKHQTILQSLFKDAPPLLTQTVANINTAYESTVHPDDIRYKVNVKPGRYWEEKTYQNNVKAVHFWKYTGNDLYAPLNVVPLLRLSEMYLILIEDLPLSSVGEYFKAYRVSRSLDVSIDNSLITEQDVSERLEKEYRKEFFGEGQMWFFYKKHNFTRFSWPKTRTIKEEVYMLPIPKSQSVFE
ncbi:RagB/SusD family nutrient uptake outer membrane protein [Butyricimonas sp. Marseille-P3923]|uniref:RagB/SusD family nutrient uptake outer membrane protein n=1 Tax=Butyricimonas sp. Marseille-P3923 TaxID=1987504 RepID=UPI000C08724A|nr:RagB/SusD family nutrient uptake outer membrane protein [Butyricimonas sp. Marseille-P3923]